MMKILHLSIYRSILISDNYTNSSMYEFYPHLFKLQVKDSYKVFHALQRQLKYSQNIP